MPMRTAAVCVFLTLVGSQYANASPILSLQAAADPHSVNLFISNVTDLFAFDLTVGFDTTPFDLTAVTEGPFLSTGGTTFFFTLPGAFVPSTNSVEIVNTLLGAVNGVTGSGVLATLMFAEAIGPGSLRLTDLAFQNSSLESIPVQTESVPEPAMLTLICAGLLGGARACRIRRKQSDESSRDVL